MAGNRKTTSIANMLGTRGHHVFGYRNTAMSTGTHGTGDWTMFKHTPSNTGILQNIWEDPSSKMRLGGDYGSYWLDVNQAGGFAHWGPGPRWKFAWFPDADTLTDSPGIGPYAAYLYMVASYWTNYYSDPYLYDGAQLANNPGNNIPGNTTGQFPKLGFYDADGNAQSTLPQLSPLAGSGGTIYPYVYGDSPHYSSNDYVTQDPATQKTFTDEFGTLYILDAHNVTPATEVPGIKNIGNHIHDTGTGPIGFPGTGTKYSPFTWIPALNLENFYCQPFYFTETDPAYTALIDGTANFLNWQQSGYDYSPVGTSTDFGASTTFAYGNISYQPYPSSLAGMSLRWWAGNKWWSGLRHPNTAADPNPEPTAGRTSVTNDYFQKIQPGYANTQNSSRGFDGNASRCKPGYAHITGIIYDVANSFNISMAKFDNTAVGHRSTSTAQSYGHEMFDNHNSSNPKAIHLGSTKFCGIKIIQQYNFAGQDNSSTTNQSSWGTTGTIGMSNNGQPFGVTGYNPTTDGNGATAGYSGRFDQFFNINKDIEDNPAAINGSGVDHSRMLYDDHNVRDHMVLIKIPFTTLGGGA